MLANARTGVRLTVGTTRLLRKPEYASVRFKSEPSHRAVDAFPYQSLNRHDTSHMSAQMESSTPLPLRSFFAQHRPLMPFAKPTSKAEEEEDHTRWVHVPTNVGRSPIFEDRPLWTFLPEQVATKIGPFNREAMLSKRFNGTSRISSAPAATPRQSRSGESSLAPLSASEMQTVLTQRFPILMEHLQKNLGAEGKIQVIPLTLPAVEEEEVEATSVRRKRKLKMNRHKYRKRLKEQRTKRRRLGK